jgi:hypothetical protein
VKRACDGDEHAFWQVGEIEDYTEHVIAFSLAGISAVRRKMKAGRTGPRQRGTYAE